MIFQTYYVSTGRKSAMRTLRVLRSDDQPRGFSRDSYVCNLAGYDNEDLALAKGAEYADAMRERIGDQPGLVIRFAGVWDDPQVRRRGRLSARDTMSIERIEDGVFPFGKHAGTRIEDAPEGYVLFFADKLGKAGNDVVADALAAACQGVALSRGWIAKRDAAKAAQHAADLRSSHVGTVGERLEFDAEVVAVVNRLGNGADVDPFQMTKLRSGDDLLIYFGLLGPDGDRLAPGTRLKVKATVKRHGEREGVKSTVVQRPALLS